MLAKAKQGVGLALYTFKNKEEALQLLIPAAAFTYVYTIRRKGVSDIGRKLFFRQK